MINGEPKTLEAFDCVACAKPSSGQCMTSIVNNRVMCRRCYIMAAHTLAQRIFTRGTPAEDRCFSCRKTGQFVTNEEGSICTDCYVESAHNEAVYAMQKIRADLDARSVLLVI